MECFRCGVSDKDEKLLEVIHKTGIVNICVKCYPKFRLPIVDKKKIDIDDVLREKSVRERLQDISHVKTEKRNEVIKKSSSEDLSLKEIVEKNFNEHRLDKDEVPADLVENFNWVVMRRRRGLKMSHMQLCEKIGEPEVIVTALEKGTLPKNYAPLIKKVENVLGIRLFKERKVDSNDLLNEAKVPGGLLVEDIKEKTKKPFSFNLFKKKERKDEDLVDLEDLDLKKVNDIVGTVEEDFDREEEKGEEGVDSQKNIKSSKKIDDDQLDSEIEENNLDEDLDSEDISKLIWRK